MLVLSLPRVAAVLHLFFPVPDQISMVLCGQFAFVQGMFQRMAV
jgi:hypothetical protein